MLRIHFIGGLCGTTMLRGAELIEEAAQKAGISVKTSIQNVWENPEVNFEGVHVLVQMLPLYTQHKTAWIVSGKPFICRKGEKESICKIIEYLKEKENDLHG